MPGHAPLADGPAAPVKPPRPAPMRPPSARTTLLRSDPEPREAPGEDGDEDTHPGPGDLDDDE